MKGLIKALCLGGLGGIGRGPGGAPKKFPMKLLTKTKNPNLPWSPSRDDDSVSKSRNRTGDSGFSKYLTGDWRLIYTTGTKKTEDVAWASD